LGGGFFPSPKKKFPGTPLGSATRRSGTANFGTTPLITIYTKLNRYYINLVKQSEAIDLMISVTCDVAGPVRGLWTGWWKRMGAQGTVTR
jgi:hypothetical protein